MDCQIKKLNPSNEAAILQAQDDILETDDIQDFDSDNEKDTGISTFPILKSSKLDPCQRDSEKEYIDAKNAKRSGDLNVEVIVIDDSD